MLFFALYVTLQFVYCCVALMYVYMCTRVGVEDTRLEAKDTNKIRGQGQGQEQLFRGQTLSKPRAGIIEAKAKDQGHRWQVLSKKRSSKFFSGDLKKNGLQKFFSGDLENFNDSKNSAVLKPKTEQFLRT